MMGPTHRFSDSQHLNKLLEKLGAAGVKVKPDMRGVPSKAFWFRRGLGLIHGNLSSSVTIPVCEESRSLLFR